MDLIKDFWTYCQSYEVPRNYAIWSALGLISAATARRVFLRQGDVIHYPQSYITLVGEQGGRKSTSMGFARSLYKEAYPDIPCAAAMQSREDIIKFMASDEDVFYFRNHEGIDEEYHPYVLFINELKNFLSFNASGMIEFLTDIYDVKFFDASTIKRGLEKIPNPCINILACETPQWIIEKLKTNVLVGGFARRNVFVYEDDAVDSLGNLVSIPRPIVSSDAREALKRVAAYLPKLAHVTGEFKWEPDAERLFDQWYHENKKNLPDDVVMRGWFRTKDVQLLKVCMRLALASYNPVLTITPQLIETGLATLFDVEKNMPKLSVAAGRNELAGPQQNAIDILERAGGWLLEKEWLVKLDKDLSPMEKVVVIRNLKEMEKIYVQVYKMPDGSNRSVAMTKTCHDYTKSKGGELP